MARKTYYLDQLGIRVEGCRNKTEARKQWEEARDEFVDRATSCPPFAFAYRGHVAILQAEPHRNSWSYTIVSPDSAGVKRPSCFFGAPSQVKAIAHLLGSLAQQCWSVDVPDDGGMFDEMVRLARLTSAEAADERSNFVTVSSHWRAHMASDAA